LFNRSYVYFKNIANLFKDVDNLKKQWRDCNYRI
jgi:hypothetical protein